MVLRKKCPMCLRKIQLTDFECKCGIIHCKLHRSISSHNCTFEYVLEQQLILAKNNPKIIADKINKI